MALGAGISFQCVGFRNELSISIELRLSKCPSVVPQNTYTDRPKAQLEWSFRATFIGGIHDHVLDLDSSHSRLSLRTLADT